MADFCRTCSLEIWGEDTGDLKGLCEPGKYVKALCEGCGYIFVDHEGSSRTYEGLKAGWDKQAEDKTKDG